MNHLSYYDATFDITYTVFFSETHVLGVERKFGVHVEDIDYLQLPSSIRAELDLLLCNHPSRRSTPKS